MDGRTSVIWFCSLFFCLLTSIAMAGNSPSRVSVPVPGLESSRNITLMAAGDTAPNHYPEVSLPYSAEEFERAFQKYFSRPWSIMIYQGWGTSTDLGQTLVFDIKSENSMFTGVAANRKMFPFWKYFTFELEGQVLRHYHKQEHWEYNGLFLVRFHPFLLDPNVDIEFAVGEGLSYATRTPVIEEEQHPAASSRFLNYLVFEFAFTHVDYREWSLVTRIHHRSGVFGLFNGTRGGSNFLALGVRHHF